MVSLLRPRVREEQVDRSQAGLGNLVPDNRYCVVLDQAQVCNFLPIYLEQAMPNARFVDFNSQVIQIRILPRLLDQRFTVAKADFEDARSLAAE